MKALLLMATALLSSGILRAQESKAAHTPNSFLAFHAGTSFPIGDFGSKNLNKENAGFAKTGYSINVSYGYEVKKGMGVAADIFFNRNKVDGASIQITDPETNHVIPVSMDHWQFYGASAGPMYSLNIGEKVMVDLKVMGGIVNANAPKITVAGMVVTNDEWGIGGILQGGADFRFNISDHLFIMANANYKYLNPKFKYTYTSVVAGQLNAEPFHQKMTMISTTAGIGFSF